MNIYHLHPADPHDPAFRGYDFFSGFVVAAEDEQSAREAVNRCADECDRDGCHNARNRYEPEPGDGTRPCVWRDPSRTACELIGVAVAGSAAGVVLESFHAG